MATTLRPSLRLLLPLLVLAHLVSGYDGDARDATGCPAVFRGKCTCGMQVYDRWGGRNDEKKDKEVYVVNCTNARFNDTEMLEQLPNGTQVLIFNGNNVPELDWNVLGIWDEHEKLEILDLSNNRIRDISGKAFHKVKNVRRLVLDHNDLMISGPLFHRRILTNFYNLESLHLTNAFTETVDSKWYLKDLKEILVASNMTKLYKLHLEQNEIWKIEDADMFCALPALTDLYLGDNQLQDVDFSLGCLKKLRYLDLEYNKIKRVEDALLDKFDAVFASETGGGGGGGDDGAGKKTINLKGNPFHCDCYLRNFYDWLTQTKTTLFHKEDIRCYTGYPESNAGKRVLNVEELACAPAGYDPDGLATAGASSAGSAVTHALLTILILLVLAVGALVVFYHRQRLQETSKALMVSFQKSMEYRTIDKEEEGAQGAYMAPPTGRTLTNSNALPPAVNV